MLRTGLFALWALIFGACLAGEAAAPAGFTRKPTAARAGDKVRIEFAVSRETDVAVFIEDAKGQVVRHLVAGILGKNPPRPLKADSLEQTVEWDGKADWGKPATGGPFKVRVALGLGAVYDKVIASDPENCGRPRGIGLGPDGTLYVAADVGTVVNWAGLQLAALNRDGSYQRTLIPVPASATKELIEFLGGASVQIGGRPAPVVTNLAKHQTTAFWPDNGGAMAVAPDGTLLVPQDGSICAVPTAGALPAGKFAGARISAAGKPADFAGGTALVVSGDGKSVYVSGLVAVEGKAGTPVPAIWRVQLPERAESACFFGDPAKPGNDEKHLASPCGMALDGKGHLLIADRDNNRVAVIAEKDGSFVGSFPADKPEAVAVDPKSGAVYVVQPAGKGGADLIKLSGWKDAKVLAKIPLATGGADKYMWSLVLDASAAPAVLWASHTRRGVLRVEDPGDKLGTPIPVAGKDKDGLYGGLAFLDVTVDHYRADPEVYARTRGGDSGYAWVRFNEATGKFEKLILDARFISGAAGTCIVPGPDNTLYALCEGLPGLFKFDHSGKALPWADPHLPEMEPGAEARYLERYKKTDKYATFVRVCMVYMTHTMGVRPDGHVFAFDRGAKLGHRGPKALYEFDPSGKKIGGPIIWMVSDNAVGPKFDQEGNIYIAEAVKPADQFVPPEYSDFVGPVKIGAAKPAGGAPLAIYGSILKFTPKGGMVDFLKPDEKPKDGLSKWARPYEGEAKLGPDLKTVDAAWCQNGALRPAKVTGAEWIRLGISHIEFPYCNCENTRFDVDPFGRVWYPDLGRYRVVVLDTAGNEITHFGGYGNAGSRGPESSDPKLAQPEIAFAWLIGVGATDRYAYMGDCLNRRLLRARLVYAAEAICPVE